MTDTASDAPEADQLAFFAAETRTAAFYDEDEDDEYDDLLPPPLPEPVRSVALVHTCSRCLVVVPRAPFH